MSKDKIYSVNRRLDHDCKEYLAGGEVSMSAEQAENLIALGILSEASDEVEEEVLQGDAGNDTLQGGGSNEPTKPEGDALTQAIMDAIDELDRDKDFTQAGAPKVASVESQLGYNVSAAEVGTAWDKYQEGNE
jgi:hypothetical protein